jgi:hypothetical protein
MTAKTIIRKFTDKGIEQFRRYLAELREGATPPPPFHLLNDPATSKPVNDEIQIDHKKMARANPGGITGIFWSRVIQTVIGICCVEYIWYTPSID